jgi:F-type H+-transporting ATPase subunit b
MIRKTRWMPALLVVLGAARPLLAADGGSDQPGLISFDLSAIVWVLISFTVVLLVLYKGAWKNVLSSLKAREDKIRGDIQQAEDARAKAEKLLAEYTAKLLSAQEEVRQLIVKATADAEKIAANMRAQAQAEGEAERDKTRKEIEAAKRQAIRQVYDQTAELATSIAAKIIARNLNPQDQQDLVTQTIGQVEAIGRN